MHPRGPAALGGAERCPANEGPPGFTVPLALPDAASCPYHTPEHELLGPCKLKELRDLVS